MEHLSEVIMIIKGGWSGDKKMVESYTELLSTKLESDGEQRQAILLRHVLEALQGKREENHLIATSTNDKVE